jgi:hypothetical protein
MIQVVLELNLLDQTEIATLAATHNASIVGKAKFPNPVPSVLEGAAIIKAVADKKVEINAHNVAGAELDAQLKTLEAAQKDFLRARASYVESVPGVTEEDVLGVDFDVKSPKTAITSLEEPNGLEAVPSRVSGVIKLRWKRRSRGAKSFDVEFKEDAPNATWTFFKHFTAMAAEVTGLEPGKRYLFRVRATGAKGLVSSWSDEAQARCL